MARVPLSTIHTDIWTDGNAAAIYIRANFASAANMLYVATGFKFPTEPMVDDVAMEYTVDTLATSPVEVEAGGMGIRWSNLIVNIRTPKTTGDGKILGIQLGEYIETRYKGLKLNDIQFTEPFTVPSSRGDWHTVQVSIPFYAES